MWVLKNINYSRILFDDWDGFIFNCLAMDLACSPIGVRFVEEKKSGSLPLDDASDDTSVASDNMEYFKSLSTVEESLSSSSITSRF